KSRLEFVKVTNRLGEFFPILKCFVKNVKDAIRDLLHKVDKNKLEELDIVHMTDNIVSAGTDTISASLTWTVAALVNNPQVHANAHEELDRIVGQSSLPTISDDPNVPYIRDIIKEGQRYCGPTHLSIPHYIEEDDEYNGYHILANSDVVFNIYEIHMDEKRYETPKYAILANGNYENRDHFSFGAAELDLLLGVSRLLWNKACLGIAVWPEEYHVKLIKRHDNVEKILFDISQ
ncbi:cytochrome P450, partial [Gigaspora rosea]